MTTPIRSHRDLVIWQRGIALVEQVYLSTAGYAYEDRDLVRQMRRAAVSVPSNIAEGRGRRKPNDFANFLGISRGSLMELDTLVEIASRLQLVECRVAGSLETEIVELLRMVTVFQRRLTPFAEHAGNQD
jgi:four helix bundle protein